MFRIIGADNQPYGPVSVEVLRQWIAEGRANGATRVQAEGSTEWKPLASFPELAALLPGGVAAPQPPQTSAPVGGWTAPTPGVPAAGPVPARDDTAARSAVRVPAILLLIAGGMGILGGLFALVQQMAGGGTMPLPPEFPPEAAQIVRLLSSLPFALLGVVLNVVVLFGGLSMLNLQRWGFAVAACFVALLCGNSCCCPIGLVGGIWGLVQLFNQGVKAAFR